MAKYKLLAGKHTGLDINGEKKSWTPGQIVETNDDLVALLGNQKFQLIEGEPGRKGARLQQSAFPAGQVSTGFQVTGGNPNQANERVEIEAHSAQEAADLAAGTKLAQPKEKESLGPVDDGLDAMSTAELRAFAAEAEIDLKGARSKDDMIKTIRGNQ